MSAFYGCSSLESIDLPNGIKEISGWAFAYCSSLKNIKFPADLESIGVYAFEYTAITTVELPDSVSWISQGAFVYCPVTTINIPAGVTDLSWIFAMRSLENVSIKSDNGNYCFVDGVLFTKDMHTLVSAKFADLKGAYVVPNTVTKIGFEKKKDVDFGMFPLEGSGFEDCTELTGVELPDGLISIDSFAFAGCTNLKWLRIGRNLSEIKWYAFDRCGSLTSLALPESVDYLSVNSLSGAALESILIANPDMVLQCNYEYRGERFTCIKNCIFSQNVVMYVIGESSRYVRGDYVNGFIDRGVEDFCKWHDKVTRADASAYLTAPVLTAITTDPVGATVHWEPLNRAQGYFVVRLAAHVSNGLKSRIHPVVGRI